jgi:hypothetical protein
MKTFTVPVFLGVNAETKQEAIEEALAFMEYAIDTGAAPFMEGRSAQPRNPDGRGYLGQGTLTLFHKE